MQTDATLQTRFNAQYIPEPMSGCWLWETSTNENGYGLIKANGRTQTAHRVSWKMRNGAIPHKLQVLHKCDVRCCVNPEHLFLGTNQDNVDDRVAKGRGKNGIGTRNSHAKIGEDEVREIRRLYAAGGVTQSTLAVKYGVERPAISKILTNRNWRHLLD